MSVIVGMGIKSSKLSAGYLNHLRRRLLDITNQRQGVHAAHVSSMLEVAEGLMCGQFVVADDECLAVN